MQRAEGRTSCEKVKKFAAYKDILYFNDGNQADEKFSEFQRKIEFTSQVWFFAIADCREMTFRTIDEEEQTYEQIPFTATLEIMNGDSHFSEENASILQGVFLSFVFVAFALLWNMYASWVDNSEYKRYDNPLFLTMCALCALASKSVFKALYMIQYAYYGEGFLVFKIQSTVCSILGQQLLCALFMMLAYGYGTVQ